MGKGYFIGPVHAGGHDYDTIEIYSIEGVKNIFRDTIEGISKCKAKPYDIYDACDHVIRFLKSQNLIENGIMNHPFLGSYKLFCVGFRKSDDSIKAEMEDFISKI
jgi:hypothetical protein